MAYKPVGIDENGNLPARAQAALDGVVKSHVTAANSQTRAALRAAYSPVLGARPPARAVFLGDSIVKGSDDPNTVTRSASWPVYASIMSGYKLRYVYNAGVAGENTDAMLSRFDASVTAKSPNLVVVGGPTNDFTTGGIGMAASKANIQAIVAKIRAIGAVPVLCTCTPAAGATPTTRRSDVIRMNAWLRRYCGEQGITLLDLYGQMVDPSTGQYLAAYASGDFIHPNAAGYAALGKYVSDTLSPILPVGHSPLPQENGDPNNLITNGLFITDADANNVPDGWTNQGGIAGQAVSLVGGDSTIKGNWFRYDVNASSGDSQLFQSKTSGITPGNTYAFMGRIKTGGFSSGSAYARIRWTATSNRDDTPVNLLTAQIDNGVFYCEVVAPAGATAVQVNLQAKAGTGWVQFAQVGLYDLTAMGVV